MHFKFIAASKGFFDAYKNLKHLMEIEPQRNGLLCFPIAVNLAFANELALKALLIQSNCKEKFRVHNLYKLFSLQTEDISSNIKSRMNCEYNYDERKFENFLNKNREVFEAWRYLEGGDKNLDCIFLEHLWNVTTLVYKTLCSKVI